jgi:hypothetical protein
VDCHCIEVVNHPKEEGFANEKHAVNAVNGILAMQYVELEKMNLKTKIQYLPSSCL